MGLFGGDSSSTTKVSDNRSAADATALVVAGTSKSNVARDDAIIAGKGARVAAPGSLMVSVTGGAGEGASTVLNMLDGGAIDKAFDLVKNTGTTMQSQVSGLLDAKATTEGKLTSQQITLLIIGAIATAIAARFFK